MLSFVIFLALLLKRQSEKAADDKLEQLETVFLLICDQESRALLKCGPRNVSHVESYGFGEAFILIQSGEETLRNHASIMFDSFASLLRTK